MSDARLNIHTLANDCTALPNIWQQSLVIQYCCGKFLVNDLPEIIDQLKERYAKPAVVKSINTWPLLTDQAGKTITVQVNGGTVQTVTLVSGVVAGQHSFEEIADQLITAGLTGVYVGLEDGQVKITSKDQGPNATLEMGGDSDIKWSLSATIFKGSGWDISQQNYNGAARIVIRDPNHEGSDLNHIEIDVPPGCYKVRTRICFGQNEETNEVVVHAACNGHYCVNLILPTLKACSAHVIHPMMDRLVNDGLMQDPDYQLHAFTGAMLVANLNRQAILDQLDAQIIEASLIGDTARVTRINNVKTVAELLPECC